MNDTVNKNICAPAAGTGKTLLDKEVDCEAGTPFFSCAGE